MSLRILGVQHRLDALPHPGRGLCLGLPDRPQDRQHVVGVDGIHGLRADGRLRIGLQRVCPLVGMLRVCPSAALMGDVFGRRLGEGRNARSGCVRGLPRVERIQAV